MSTKYDTKKTKIEHRKAIIYPDDYNPILEYWEAIKSGKEVVSQKVYKTYQKVVADLLNTNPDSKYHYSNSRANHILEFIENFCIQSKAKWGGKPVKLELWEKALLSTIFGFVDANGYRKYREALVILGKKNGKQVAIDTLIPTPSGFVTMGDIKIGDIVFDENGNQCNVVAKSKIDYKEQAYRITFRDGEIIEAGQNHEWYGEWQYGKKKGIVNTKWLYERSKMPCYSNQNSLDFRISLNGAIQTKEKELPIHPYLMGYWLGNGNTVKPEITIQTCDLDEVLSYITPYHKISSSWNNVGGSVVVRIPDLKKILIKSFHDKKIPIEYLRASDKQRLELLQGLMDSDGCISDRKGQATYTSTEKGLADSVSQLLWTLGIKNAITSAKCSQRLDWTKSSKECGRKLTGEIAYLVKFVAFKDTKITGLVRKQCRAIERKAGNRSQYRYIKSIEPINNKGMQCIQVDSINNLYLIGKSCLPTHNSLLSSSIGLYLMIADNEPGAEIYSVATTLNQAKIIWSESKKMVQASPYLRRYIKPLVSQMTSSFNNSSFMPVANDDGNGKLDGLNIHGCLIDELHAWKNGHDLYEILAKGISAREQPLIFVTSTAGTVREDIFDEKYDEATKVINGYSDPKGSHNEHFISFIYELDSKKEYTNPKCWKKANPNLRITKSYEYLEGEVAKAKANPLLKKGVLCKEFNIRETASDVSMSFEQLNNKTKFNILKLKPKYGIGGVDFSSRIDLTAACVLFRVPDDENIYFEHMYWIPDDILEKRAHEDGAGYVQWHKDGFLRTSEGNKVKAQDVVDWFLELRDKYDLYVPYIGYDAWSADYFVDKIRNNFGQDVPIPVPQTMRVLSDPMKVLLAEFSSHKVAYNDNPVTKYCLQNTSHIQDKNGNIKPCKTHNQRKRIDGFAAMLDAFVVYQDKMDEYMSII